MTRIRFRTEHAARYGIAALAGVLLALAFPKPGIAGLAWVAPGLLLFAGLGANFRTAFRAGWIGGLVYYLCTLYWLLLIPVTFLPILGWAALSAYLALYPALWVWACWKIAPWQIAAERYPWRTRIPESAWWRRAAWALECGILWVALEMILGRFLSGFPWDFLGVSQYRQIPVIQIAEFCGVYGVSFLIVWFSAALLLTALALARHPVHRRLWSGELALPLLVVIGLSWFGMHRVAGLESSDHTVRVALVQPSIPQTLIWDERENDARFKQLLRLSEAALSEHPDILVWPEASVPNMLRFDQATADAVIDLAKHYKVWIILGSDDAERRESTSDKPEVDFYNSAFAISPAGELKGIYRKRRLVIFGEYVPFVKWLPFLKILSPAGESGFTPGERPIPFALGSLGLNVSVLICFEDTFPHVARDYVKTDTDFLVNLTNNGWFGESAAQWQHAATAAFRAVENRIPLVRCANNGLTCWVDSAGVMREEYFPGSPNVYKAGYKIAEIPARAGKTRNLSFYTRHGDVFGWSCCAISGVALFWNSRKKKRISRAPAQLLGEP